MTTLTDEELGTVTNDDVSTDDKVYRGTFEGRLVGTATSAKQLEVPFKLELQGDVAGNVDISGKQGVILQTTVSHATEADRAEYAGNTALATNANYADLANLANYAVESGKAKQTDHALKSDTADLATKATLATRATLADKAEGLTWDMIQVVTEYPTNIAQGVLYIKVFDEFHNNGWEIVGFKYKGKDGLINTTDLSLYRIRYTNRALTEDFLEHRRIWATPSPERALTNIKGEIEQINVAERDTTVEELAQREAKFFKQEDLL